MLRLDMHMIAGVLQYVAVASFAEAWIENTTAIRLPLQDGVASFAEAWIENNFSRYLKKGKRVASFAEAWIENVIDCQFAENYQSPPSRRRGLKNETCFMVHIRPSRLLRGGVD